MKVFYFVSGAIISALVYYLVLLLIMPRPEFEAMEISKERASYLAKAHVQCFETELARWALQDSVYIPLDSIEDVYNRVCGIKIDSLIQ